MAADEFRKIIDHLTPKQRDVLGQIFMNQDSGHHPKTLAVLMKKGLIEETAQEMPFIGRLKMTVKRYHPASMAVHMAWCDWCSDHYDEDGNLK